MPAFGDVALLLILLAVLFAFFAWWAWGVRRGVRIRVWVMVLFGVGYVGLFLLVEREEVVFLRWGGLGRLAALVNVVLVAVTLAYSYLHTARTIRLQRSDQGYWQFQGMVTIPVVWLSLFLLRLGTELALLGRIYLFDPTPQHVPLPNFAAALLLVDGLYSVATGLVLGYYGGIYDRYHRARRPQSLAEGVPAHVAQSPPGL
jgi:hypothetical protein